MRDERLKQLLAEADAAHLTPAVNVPVAAAAARKRAARRQDRRRRAAMTLGMFILAAALWHNMPMLDHAPQPGPIIAQDAPAPPLLQTARLLAEAQERMALVDKMIQAEKQRDALAAPPPITASQIIEQQVELAGLILLKRADEKRNRPGLEASAIDDYRQLVLDFAQTPAAAEARQRLKEMMM